jgi:hypothetical protein
MENVLFEQMKVKVWNKLYFMGNQTDDAACP